MVLNTLCDRCWRILLQNYALIALTFVVGIVIYGAEICNYSLSIDEEVSLTQGNFALLVHVKRWAILAFAGILCPETGILFFSPLYTVFLLSIAAALFANLFTATPLEKVTLSVLFMAFPQFEYQMFFAYQGPYMGWGYIFSLLAFNCYLRFITKRNVLHFLAAVLLTTVAVGIYQNFIFW